MILGITITFKIVSKGLMKKDMNQIMFIQEMIIDLNLIEVIVIPKWLQVTDRRVHRILKINHRLEDNNQRMKSKVKMT